MPSASLRLSGLNANTSAKELHRAFSIMGKVTVVQLDHDAAGLLLGTATIVFEEQASAYRALREFDQVLFDGNEVRVTRCGQVRNDLGGGEAYENWLHSRRDSQF